MLRQGNDFFLVFLVFDDHVAFLDEVKILGLGSTFKDGLSRVEHVALEVGQDGDDEGVFGDEWQLVVVEEFLEVLVVVLEDDENEVDFVFWFEEVEKAVDGDDMVDAVFVLDVQEFHGVFVIFRSKPDLRHPI